MKDVNEINFGIFMYYEDGFSVRLEKGNRKVHWSEIEKTEAYKEDLMTTDMVCLDIVLTESVISINEEVNGYEYFIKELEKQFQSIEKGWEWKLIQPPFAKNHMLLFTKM
jgi:hypothetical protein